MLDSPGSPEVGSESHFIQPKGKGRGPVTNAVVHNTDVVSFKKCRQSWQWSSPLLGNLEPTRTPDPLSFGTAIHAGLESYYSGQSEEEVLGSFSGTLYSEVYFEGWGDEDEAAFEDNKEKGLGILRHYMTWAPNNDDFEVVWVEKPYVIPLIDGYDYGFKPDGLVKDKHGRYWILEHKTAAKIYDHYDHLLTDDQAGRYLWGLQEAEGIKLEGIIYTFIRKDAPKPLKVLKNGFFSMDKRQNTTYDIAKAQITQKFGKVPESYDDFLEYLRIGNKFFHREPVRRNQTEITLIGASLKVEVEEMVNAPKIYRSPSQWNCSTCPFLNACVEKWSGNDPILILEGNFRQREPAG